MMEAEEIKQKEIEHKSFNKAVAHAKETDRFYSSSIEGYRLRAKNSYQQGYLDAAKEYSRQIDFKEDIDTIGNCANCGVEFHIHKEAEIQK